MPSDHAASSTPTLSLAPAAPQGRPAELTAAGAPGAPPDRVAAFTDRFAAAQLAAIDILMSLATDHAASNPREARLAAAAILRARPTPPPPAPAPPEPPDPEDEKDRIVFGAIDRALRHIERTKARAALHELIESFEEAATEAQAERADEGQPDDEPENNPAGDNPPDPDGGLPNPPGAPAPAPGVPRANPSERRAEEPTPIAESPPDSFLAAWPPGWGRRQTSRLKASRPCRGPFPFPPDLAGPRAPPATPD